MKAIEWFRKFPLFVRDVRIELKKTSFPSRAEVTTTTLVVMVTVLIFGVYLWIVDSVVFALLNKLFEQFR